MFSPKIVAVAYFIYKNMWVSKCAYIQIFMKTHKFLKISKIRQSKHAVFLDSSYKILYIHALYPLTKLFKILHF